MVSFTAKITQRPDFANVSKLIERGTAWALTQTAKDVQREVQYKIKKTMITRKEWFAQSSPIGIKVKHAVTRDLRAEISTSAFFGRLQDEGGTKLPYKNWIAVPTENVRPTKNALIPKALRPGNLKNAFVITARSGAKLLCVRAAMGTNKRGQFRILGKRLSKGMGKDLVVMYILKKDVKIKRTDFFTETAKYYSKRWLPVHMRRGIAHALATGKVERFA